VRSAGGWWSPIAAIARSRSWMSRHGPLGLRKSTRSLPGYQQFLTWLSESEIKSEGLDIGFVIC
jgi:hypothetical protein